MGDINRNIDGDLIHRDENLRRLHLTVLLNEKLNQIKALDVHLDNLRTVEMKRLELKKEVLQKEIQDLQRDLKSPHIIEVKPKK